MATPSRPDDPSPQFAAGGILLLITDVTPNSVSLAWEQPPGMLAGYNVRYIVSGQTPSTGAWSALDTISDFSSGSGASYAYSESGLASGSARCYRVHADIQFITGWSPASDSNETCALTG